MPTDQPPQDNFDLLLSWLASDREQAGEKYEEIRRNLMDYFRRRDVSDPLSLTDEVFVRVTGKVVKVAPDFVGDPYVYFLAVARRVLAEWWRRPGETDLPDDLPESTDSGTRELKESKLQSLELCWVRLPPAERQILYRYCVETPPLKLAKSRELLANEMNLSLNALRVMAHRIRRKLKFCIVKSMENKNVK